MSRPTGAATTLGATSAAAESFLLSSDHLAALAASAVACGALPLAARSHPGAWTRLVSCGLAVLLVAWVAAYYVVVALRGQFEPDSDLPLHLTDIVTVTAALALWSRSPLLFELTYFWGLTAALLAILTPGLDPDEGLSSFFFWQYFVTHSGVVLAALFLAFGLGMTARSAAVRRVFLATVAWAAIATAGNVFTGGNYMFLRERPETPSVLDYMGPWPWYILSAASLALTLFALLDLPFRSRRDRALVTTPRR
jgi:hypothetical integral membrane protein (TIGR02206 family)